MGDNIKMDLAEVGLERVDSILPAEDRYRWQVFENTVLNLRVLQKMNFLTSIAYY
jgi:hypothetical protein